MSSMKWLIDVDKDNVPDYKKSPDYEIGEIGWTDFSEESRIAIHPTSGIVFLAGCDTGHIVGKDDNFEKSPLRSRYLVTATRGNMMLKEYLEHGAPAVIASTAGSDAGDENLNYYFYQHLIDQDQRAGDAFYAAQEDYARKHGLQRAIRVYNYFGDPSLLLRGIENRPGGPDTLVKEGSYWAYAADNAEDGTRTRSGASSAICVSL